MAVAGKGPMPGKPSKPVSQPLTEEERYKLLVAKELCERSHLFFTRYFFKKRQGIKFVVNWHHVLFADIIQDIFDGKRFNEIINVSPGASKTEMTVINFIARGIALYPRARFLHLSGSDNLASQNSATAREIVLSDDYQTLWPRQIADDENAKKRWNVMQGDFKAGGVYATALGGQVTGFRAGHMAEGFQGAVLIDDPVKPEDAFSKVAFKDANRTLVTTVKSRRATSKTPILLIMQRLGDGDPSDFLEKGGLEIPFNVTKIPAVIDGDYLRGLKDRYIQQMDRTHEVAGRFSYWPFKEPLEQLLAMEKGGAQDRDGKRISSFVFNGQYQQQPNKLGGNIIRGEYFRRYKVLPQIKYRRIYGDTAQKTKEHNDFSVFEEWGLGVDGWLYLLNLIRGKWEAPELQSRLIAFWAAAIARDKEKFGQVRKIKVEDKSSGTGLVQTLKLPPYSMPIEGIQRSTDRYMRVMDGLPYIQAGQLWIPEDAAYTNDFVTECESYSPDDTHDHDDQIDPMLDAIDEMLQAGNKLKQWSDLGKKVEPGQPSEGKTFWQQQIEKAQQGQPGVTVPIRPFPNVPRN
jgi:predicted phage terminase large subunit-like protein